MAGKLELPRLKAKANYSPYGLAPAAPAWLNGLHSALGDDFGALALLGPSGLSVRSYDGTQQRAHLQPAALIASLFCQPLTQQRKRLGLALPKSAEQFPLLVSGLSILGQAIEREFSAKGLDSRAGVLVISPDLDARARYGDLFVKNVPLNDAYPGSRMKRDGKCVSLTSSQKDGSTRGVCFFFPGLELPERIDFHPSIVVLDLRYALWIKRTQPLLDWLKKTCPQSGILALYTLGDVETEFLLERFGVPSFPLDQAALAACESSFTKYGPPPAKLDIDWDFNRSIKSLNKDFRIIYVDNALEIENVVEKIWGVLIENSKSTSPNIGRARWICASLSQLPCPIKFYEEAAFAANRPGLHRMIASLGYLGNHDSELGPVSQTLRTLLTDLYDQLFKVNPRARVMAKVIKQRLDSKERTLLLARDRLSRDAIKRWLETDLLKDTNYSETITVLAFSDLLHSHPEEPFSTIISGAFPRRYRWVPWTFPSTSLSGVVYGHEAKLLRDQVEVIFGDAQQALRSRKRQGALASLGIPVASGGVDPLLSKPTLTEVGSPAQEKTKFTKTLSGFDALAAAMKKSSMEKPSESQKRPSIGEDASDEDAPISDLVASIPDGEAGELPCVGLRVRSVQRGAGKLWLPSEQLVEFVRSAESETIKNGEARDLRKGDVLLMADEGERSLLFSRVLDLAERQPRYCHLSTYRAVWKSAMEKLALRFQSNGRIAYPHLLKELRAFGATIEHALSLRFWLGGIVLGPQTEESIRAVGKLSGIKQLEEKSDEFDRAFRQMRGIHQGLGRRLSSAIRRAFRGLTGETESVNLMKDSLDLPIEEIAESIDMLEIIEIDSEGKRVPAYCVGRVIPMGAK